LAVPRAGGGGGGGRGGRSRGRSQKKRARKQRGGKPGADRAGLGKGAVGSRGARWGDWKKTRGGLGAGRRGRNRGPVWTGPGGGPKPRRGIENKKKALFGGR